MAKVNGARQRLLTRLDTIERRVARLSAPDPSLQVLEKQVEKQRGERERANERLAELDKKLKKLAERPVNRDGKPEDPVKKHLDARVASAMEAVEERLGRNTSAMAPERILNRVVMLETAVQRQQTAIIELRDCSIRNEERMQKILNGVDSLISGNLTRSSR